MYTDRLVITGDTMKMTVVAGFIWGVFIFCIWAAAQGNSVIYHDIAQQTAKQMVLETQIATQSQAISDLKDGIKTNRAVTQQVGADLYVLKGVFIGFGGLMTFLQFLTVLT